MECYALTQLLPNVAVMPETIRAETQDAVNFKTSSL